jgi:hypothetical protein
MELTEMFLSQYLSSVQQDPEGTPDCAGFLKSVQDRIPDYRSPQPGHGLSKRQLLLLNRLNELAFTDRLVFECLDIEHLSKTDYKAICSTPIADEHRIRLRIQKELSSLYRQDGNHVYEHKTQRKQRTAEKRPFNGRKSAFPGRKRSGTKRAGPKSRTPFRGKRSGSTGKSR